MSGPVSEHASEALSTMAKFKDRDFLCDFVIKVDGKSFNVHRTVIAACSRYFESMLSHDMKERREGEVEMEDVDPDAVERCINYMYTGKVEASFENAESLLHASRLMQLDEMAEDVFKVMVTLISAENCLKMKALALTYNSEKMAKETEDFVAKNFEAVAEGQAFLKISHEDVVKYANLNGDHTQTWKSVIKWIEHEKETRSKLLDNIIKEVDYSYFPFPFLIEKLTSDEIITRSDDRKMTMMTAVCRKLENEDSTVTIDNCLTLKLLFKIIQPKKSSKAKKVVDEFIARHLTDIYKKKDFLELTGSDILTYLRSPYTKLLSEKMKWNLIVSWVEHDDDMRDVMFDEMFSCLDINKLPTDFIHDKVLPEPFITTSHKCKDLLLKALCETRREKNSWIVKINKLNLQTTLYHAYSRKEFWENSDVSIPADTKEKDNTSAEPISELIRQTKKQGGLCCNVKKAGYSTADSQTLAKDKKPENGTSPALPAARPTAQFPHKPETGRVMITTVSDDVYCLVNSVLYCLEVQSRQNWFKITEMEEPLFTLQDKVKICSSEGRIYFIGNRILHFDLTQSKWETDVKRFRKISDHSVAVCDSTIYVIGGTRRYESGAVGSSTDVDVLSCKTNEWSKAPPTLKIHINASANELHGLVYVVGGSLFSPVEFFNPLSQIWTEVASLTNPHTNLFTGVLDGKLYVFGDENSCTEEYSEENNEWTVVEDICIKDSAATCLKLE